MLPFRTNSRYHDRVLNSQKLSQPTPTWRQPATATTQLIPPPLLPSLSPQFYSGLANDEWCGFHDQDEAVFRLDKGKIGLKEKGVWSLTNVISLCLQ